MKIRSFRKDKIMENPFNVKAVRLLDLPEGEIIHLTLDKGEKMIPHIPPVTLAIYMLEGVMNVELDEENREISVDDCLEVPQGSRLAGVNSGESRTRMIICRVPRPVTAPVILDEN